MIASRIENMGKRPKSSTAYLNNSKPLSCKIISAVLTHLAVIQVVLVPIPKILWIKTIPEKREGGK